MPPFFGIMLAILIGIVCILFLVAIDIAKRR